MRQKKFSNNSSSFYSSLVVTQFFTSIVFIFWEKIKKIQKKYVFSINLVNFIDFFIVFMLKNNKIYLESKLDQ
jgi:hypothetical protein